MIESKWSGQDTGYIWILSAPEEEFGMHSGTVPPFLEMLPLQHAFIRTCPENSHFHNLDPFSISSISISLSVLPPSRLGLMGPEHIL